MSSPYIVLADDLTGATELAGVAMRYGLRAKVFTQAELYQSAAADERMVLCYDTDTRRLSTPEAAARTYQFAQAVAAPDQRLFKKTDSLLRGHPAAEIEALLQLPQWRRALLCPANPERGRTIERGDYYVDGALLTQSSLADDPEHPRVSNKVYELLQKSACEAMEVPDVTSSADLRRQAARLAPGILPAGGAEFFAAILQREGHTLKGRVEHPLPQPILPTPWCLVCGSRTGWHQGRQREAFVHRIPCLLVTDLKPAAFEQALKTHAAVWLAVGEPAQHAPATYWLELLATEVAQCVQAYRIGTLLLEGGATARAVIEHCGWRRFEVEGELAPGCVAMRGEDPAAPLLVTKPGSYPWPESLWKSTGADTRF